MVLNVGFLVVCFSISAFFLNPANLGQDHRVQGDFRSGTYRPKLWILLRALKSLFDEDWTTNN